MKTFLRHVLLLLGTALVLQAASDVRKRVALVVDDGPIPETNAAFLALLAKENVRVTFSHVGNRVVAHPEMAKAAAAAGHEIINHSYTHPHLKNFADDAITKEIADTQAAVQAATGHTPAWFWAPFLERDDRVDAAVRRAGLEHFPFNRFHFIGSEDWVPSTPAEKFRQLCTTGVVDGTVILLHEFPKVTLENLGWVLQELKRQGVEFVTFSELAAGK